uniref:glutaminyl-peptide cyclotransferase n=1 Tax=Timema tahoe TaxID=61484 RepID=A0A7R9IGH6_9NEOP|nr:unnamed protein product [Timema tahoe]
MQCRQHEGTYRAKMHITITDVPEIPQGLFPWCGYSPIIPPVDISAKDDPFQSPGLGHNTPKRHQPRSLNADQILKLSALSNVTQFQSVLNTVIQPRVVGTEGHERVKQYLMNYMNVPHYCSQYLMNYMNTLGWTVETDVFKDSTPIFGTLQFTNVIAKLNPNAQRFLTLACHYDSKYVREYTFNGATDSAVPCSMMLNMAYVMRNVFNSAKNKVGQRFNLYAQLTQIGDWRTIYSKL